VYKCEILLAAGKREIVLKSPVLSAAGALGYHPRATPAEGIDLLGAFVTPVLTWRPRMHARPGVLATTGGAILRTEGRNPGLRRALRDHGRQWATLGVPLIAAVYASSYDDLAASAEYLEENSPARALEIHFPYDSTPEDYTEMLGILAEETTLPYSVCVQACRAPELALAAQDMGAVAVVVAEPLYGQSLDTDGKQVAGPLHAPALAPYFCEVVCRVARAVELPILARGGIATPNDALSALASGAVAVQVDSILHVNPRAIIQILGEIEDETARCGVTTWQEMLMTLRATSRDGSVRAHG